MRKNIYVLLITLIIGVYFSFVPGTVRAQSYTFVGFGSLSQDTITTNLDDTDDYTFTLTFGAGTDATNGDTIAFDITLTDPDEEQIMVSSSGDETTKTPSLDKYSVSFTEEIQGEITLTVPRQALSKVGEYTVKVSATPQGATEKEGDSVSISFTVKAPIVKPYEVRITGTTNELSLHLSDPTDATYTLYVKNNGTKSDRILLTVFSDLHYVTITPTAILLDAKTGDNVTLAIPRASFPEAGVFAIIVEAVSENDATAMATFLIRVYVTDGRSTPDPTAPTPDPTAPTPDPTAPTPDQSPHKVILSEFMFESENGVVNGLPQWLEIYNRSTTEINLRGWKLQWKQLKPSPLDVTATFQEDFIIPSQQCRVIVSAYGRYSGTKDDGKNKLSNDNVFLLSRLLAGPPADDQEGAPAVQEDGPAVQEDGPAVQENIENSNLLIAKGGFSLKLLNPNDEIIDQIGTLNENKQTWQLHESLIEGVRSSLIRRFEDGVPRSGMERQGWRRASDAKDLPTGIYYGHWTDLSTPGHRKNMPVPVELSQFSARFIENEVIIKWTTESELNNTGFNIYRSTSPTKDFRRINVKLVQGAGTTGERNTYQFIDKTAKPNVLYYYRLEDVDFSGKRDISTTYRLRGVIAPTGKHLTTWGTLKDNR